MFKKITTATTASIIFSGLMLGSVSAMEVSPQNSLVETSVDEINQNDQGIFNPELLNAFDTIFNEERNKMNSNLSRISATNEDDIYKIVGERIANFMEMQENGEGESLQGIALYSAYDDLSSIINDKLGPTEQKVFKSNPLMGAYVLADAKLARDSAESNYTDLHNGKGDAYRHALWQGLSAFHTTKSYAKEFGDAHEVDFPPAKGSELETTMDYFNNSVGRDIGDSKWIITSVYSGIKDAVSDGSLKYIKNGKLVYTNQ